MSREELLRAALQKKVKQQVGAAQGQERIPRADRTRPLPVSLPQQRLWFVDRLDKAASAANHVPAAMRLVGRLDIAALQATLDRVVARHEGLRTSFVAIDGVPCQQIAPETCGFSLRRDDLKHLSADERETAVARITIEETRAPFDMSTGPLIRGRLLELANDEHVLLITQHHIITDGWSLGILMREVATLYAAFSRGNADPLPPLEIQYADYAQWQRQWLQGEELARQAGFWKEHLTGAPELLQLPLDRPRPAVQSFAGGHVPLALSRELSARLRAVCQRHDITPFMVLLSAWGLLLSRLSRQRDVVVGTAVANRQRRELENLIGFFVNTLALRLRFDDAATVDQLFAQIKETTLAAFAHQELPFEQVVEAIQPQRSLSHSPLFQTTLAFNNTSEGEGSLSLPELQLAPAKQGLETAQYELSLSLSDGEQLSGTIVYASDIFDRATIERWAGYYVQLLDAIVANPSAKVANLSLMSDSERRQLLADFNDTASEYPKDALIQELFEQQAAAHPDAIAVVCENESLTYAELNVRANQLAHELIGRGVQPDDRVAVRAERSLELVVGFLGILKAGGAYLPLDSSWPEERLQYLLHDAAPKVVLTQDDLQRSRNEQPTHNPAVDGLHARNLAYVIYTSGSTGTPKGVMVDHRCVTRLVISNPYFEPTPADCFAHCANPAFDAATWEIWGALLNGARVLVVPPSVVMEPAQLNATLHANGVTALWLTVGLFNQYVGSLPDAFARLRYLLVGGDALDPKTIRQLLASDHRPQHVINGYGPTETTTFAITHEIRSVADDARSIPLGKPIANTQIYILDERGEPVPIGVEGEIYIGGDGVARGYLNRPELTEERFVTNPFAEGRLYKSGDRGRWLPDGTIEFLGRNDLQVKLRGFRIELGEIEAKLAQCAGVREAIVLAREDAPGDKRLVAYIVAGEELQPARLRDALQSQMPDYMIPSAFMQLDELPLTANGKVDRKALPAPEATALITREYEAPRGEIEETLAAIWQELLRVERVGRHDNFFELGGHSLLIITMVERLRALGFSGEVRGVFASPALCDYAATLRRDDAAAADVPPNLLTPETDVITPELLPLVALSQSEIDRIVAAVPGGARNVQDVYPLLPLQEGMLFHHLLETEGDTYLLRDLIAFDSKERLERFLSVLQQLIARHDILRTAVAWDGLSAPVQVVHREAPLPVEFAQLSGERDAIEELRELTDPRRMRLDLRRAPLMAAYAAEDRKNGEWVLALLTHHMVCDHETLTFVMADVYALLRDEGRQLAAPTPLRNLVAQTSRVPKSEHEAYFREQLADIDAPTAPFGVLDLQVRSTDLDTVALRLDHDLSRRLRDSAALLGVPPSVLFHVAWAQVLGRCTGRSDVVFGTVLSGRMQGSAGADRALGMFINTLPLRVSLDTDARRAVQQSYERMVSLLAHEQAPLVLAQRCSGVPPQLPLFTTLFNYRHSGGETVASEAPEVEGIRLLSVHEAANYPIVASVDDFGQQFSLKLQSVRALDPARILRYMQAALHELTAALESDAQQPLRALDVLPADERATLLYGFNATQAEYPRQALIHELFEQQAAARPDAIAVMCGDESLTYAELNTRANQLAHELIARGVQPDDRIAIRAERSLELVTGFLGVLKAGGAYLPLDSSWPEERLQYLLDDAAPKVVLTQDDLRRSRSEQPAHNPTVDGLHARNLAYVIYTSGSTGTPKGVMVDHRCVTRLVINNPYFEATPADCFAHCANPAFDAATWEIWGALLNGARLLIVPPSVVMEPAQLNATLHANGVTALWLTVGLFNQYVDSLPDAFAQLRYLLVGGDALDPKTIRQLLAGDHRPRHVINGYGPTETTTFAITHEIVSVPDDARSIPLGKPIANTQIYILDEHGEPVPAGVEGEIYIGGDGVARGYLNRPELTEERFVANPFAPGCMYRSGDRGRWLSDGTIEFLGRNDFQVKIRGFRIELGEIEAKLSTCDGVRDAIVLVREDAPGDKRLVAYLVAEAELSAAELRDALSRQLPDYMVPSAFVQVDDLPLTANGKVDRRALPAPEASALQVRQYEAPRGEIEQTLAGLWQQLLRVERVGRHDNFFELGGHSLLAVQLISHIRAALHVELPLRDLFIAPSLSGLAEVVRAAAESTLGRIEVVDRGRPLPLSLAQQRLWFIDQLDHAASAAYHMPAALRLIGNLDIEALRATLDRVVARHEGLRTHFVAIDGVPYQQIAPADCGFALQYEECGEELVAEIAAAEARAPFDLSTGPLIRGRLLRVKNDEHVLLVTQHHIVSDGWSLNVLVREVAALYTAFSRGESDPLPPLEIQYADYAQWQRQWLQGEELTRQFDFWKSHLDGAPALLSLPADRPRPAVQSYAGDSVPFVLSSELTASLREFSQRHGVTLFMTLLSAWGALLSRLSGQTDVVIGTPVANRQRREVENLIGFFVNTLALRLRFDDAGVGQALSLSSLLQQVKETTLAAFAHQELPFEQVVEALQPERSQSHSPVAQVTFTWNNLQGSAGDGGTLELPGLKLAPVQRAHETTQVDLQLLLDDTGEMLAGGLIYARALFDRATIERWAGHYVRVLEAMVADVSTTVDALPLLSQSERQQLEAFNATQAAYPRDKRIHELFEEQAAAQPDAIAVVYKGESLAYAELNARANQLAHYLRGLGVQTDDRVAICTERNLDLIVGLLGILKAGGAYVPLDPAYPRERLSWMLDDSAPVALLIHSDVEELLPETDVPVLRLDIDLPILARKLPATNPTPAGDLAYVIYTSGSTGTPKGVMVDHRCVNRLVINNPYFEATSSDCFAHCANPAFDAATWEIWGALLNGARLLVVPPSIVMNPAQLSTTLHANGVTALWLTVGLFNQYVDKLPDAFAQLRYLLVGGDALDPKTIRQLLNSDHRPLHVINGYGPTETTTFAITHDIVSVADDARSIPLGKPIANTRIYILDARGEQTPIGVEGEIYIGGDGVARGYLNRPELTAERFVVNPFGEGRLYKSGDRGRWLADGTIEFLGRNDFQVKIRGFRIELGEIEAKLAQCEGVREAIVLAREDAPGDKRLVAYIVGDTELSASDLRAALSQELPDYMIPSAFVQLDELPLTANGKVDRQALPAPEANALQTREYEAPHDEIEQRIATLWQELLHVERVGRHDNFFELGGHSLLAVQLISHIRAALNVELPLRELFATPNLSALADAVRAAGASTLGRIEIADRNQPIPLSLAQQRLWFLDQLDQAASAAYHMPAAMRLIGNLDIEALRATLDRVVARHESLRTRFVAIDGVPYQQFAAENCGFTLRYETCSEADVARITAEEARTPFDLSTGPLIRGRLLRVNDDEHVLLVTQHHIISDGWSLNILVREVAALYTAFSRGEADPLPPLEIQYADYAQWQRSWLQGDELARQFEFWKSHLSGAPALLALPADRPRPAVQSHAGGTVPFVIPAALTSELRAFSQRHGVTMFMTLLSAWGALLSRLSGQSDVVIGTPVANRQRREVESLIGFFVNTLALRLRLDGVGQALSLSTLLQQVKETTLAAFAHQELPFEQVVEALQPERSLSHSPVAQVTFTWNNLEGSEGDGNALELPGLKLAPVTRSHETTQVDLQLLLDDAGDVLAGGFVYASALFDRATIERWAGHYVRVLEAMVADVSTTVDALPLLSQSERQQLEAFNATQAAYPRDKRIHELFEEQAVAQPDAIAVVYEGESLTYAELNARANQLAHYLRGLGVQTDDRVAICTERNLDLIVGLLGILKAGGAYVPLDPAYPRERLSWMLDDSAPAALLMHSDVEELLPETDVPVLRLDIDLPILARKLPATNPTPAGDLAYVIYTSGSTGTPKGVMVDHRCVNRLVINNPYFEATSSDCFAHCANPAFDAATWEIWGALLNGARLLVVPPSIVMNPAQLNTTLHANGVTALWLTIGLFNQYVDKLPDAFAQLRYLLVGGDALDPKTIRQLLASDYRPQHVINGYGPTETTTFAITHDIVSVADDARSIPLGKPIANTRIYILDARGERTPIGVEGEIYIGGDGVARGYLNRPELTAERFVVNPFGEGRLYKSGDRGRWLADGTIEFLGRNDFQVKIRGFRIELGEIEAKLAQCEGVREAIVLAREDAPGDKRLVAYIAADDELSASDLRAALSQELPDYMIPSAFVQLDELPLTANGKVDRQALPAPEANALQTREYEAPQDEIEQALATLWQELLHVDRVGRHDNFFELGGHSLLAVQLISHIRAALNVEVPLRELFATASLSALADAVRAAGASTLGRIEVADRNQPIPLSLAQQRLWFLDQLDKSASAAYHIPAALRLLGKLDVAALQATLDRVVARHEGLRTRFVAIDGVPYQQFAPADCGFALRCEECTGERVAQITAEEARTPFDLSTGPLIRGRLLRVSDEEHVLLVTQHHIVSDGWSLNILVREVATLYTAFTRAEGDPLPPLELQYADYALWQRQWLQGDELTRQYDFWKSHLANAPALLELPTDHPRPAVQSHAGATVPVMLSAKLSADLRAFSQRHGVTLFMTMLSAWGLLLSRLSGQSDVVVGTPVANRQRREVENLIGFFVNTLALRLRFDDAGVGQALSLSSLLQQVKETTLAAFAHQELPFDQVVEAVQPQRSMSHGPLFQTMLALNNTESSGGDELELPGLRLAPAGSPLTTARHDLALNLSDTGDALSGILDYCSDLFDRDTVERWAGYYVRVLEAMVADASATADALPLLSEAERKQLDAFNDTDVAYPQETLIHELFEQQVIAQPDAIAVSFEDRSLTYAELNARANQLAHELIALGVQPDDRVAITIERSLEMVIGLLGILKAGGAYVPIDPNQPRERMEWMLADCAPKAVLTREFIQQPSTRPAHNPESRVGVSNLAYVIYTSGSTGMPKGVLNEHRGVVNRLYWAQSEYKLQHDDRVLQKTPYTFDVSVWEFFLPLLAGARLVMARPGGHQDPAYLADVIERESITTIHFVPSMLPAFLTRANAENCRSLRRMLFSGEALPHNLLEAVVDRLPHVEVHNLYGPTEAAVDVTAWPCKPGQYGQIVPIGRPIANTQIHILDSRLQPVPVGVAGELYIGGVQVARGYLNRPELTAERFVENRDGGRMYKTGDLGRWLRDGNIEYLGRNDFQVKIRGFRIELGEIEAKLAQCAGVREAVVIAREDNGDKRLIAYVVADQPLQASQLREALLTQLPEYMVPSAFVQLDVMPLSANGKLDRKALPAPDASALIRREYEAPQGEIEETLAAIWRDLLHVERVGRHDNFFELGGHSLLAVQLTSRVRAALDVELPLRTLFSASTLSAQAEAVRNAAASTMERIERADRNQPLPLSLAQQRLWFLDQLDHAASTAYHMPAALRLLGKLDVAALQKTLDRLVARHESLRTSFISIDGVPHQQIAPEDCGFALRFEECDAEDVARVTAEEARAAFDLSRGPLIRGRLLRITDDEHVLLVTQHHIVTDGWSMGIVLREVAALYAAFARGESDPLPALEIQYADYAQWQRQWLRGEELTRQFAFWKEHLTGAPALIDLPLDRPRPAVESHSGGTVSLVLPAALAARLRAFSQQHGVTVFMTLLSAWGALLSRLSGQSDVVIGTPVANRQRREVENLIGFFVNTLALRLRFDEQPTVASLLEQVKETTLAAFAHQELPFEQVVEAVQPQRSLSHSPLFQTMLAFNNTPEGDGDVLSLPDLKLAPAKQGLEVAQYELSLNLNDGGEQLTGTIVYATDIFDRATIERWAGYYVQLLDAMMVEPSTSIANLSLMSEPERRQVLVEFNDTAAEYPKETLIHQLFEKQAAAQPDAIAVRFEGQQLTYAELNTRANQLAHELIALGVRPDDRVGISVERSLEMIVGLLGILKAGGAYLPLDPSYPAERLQYLMQDGAPKVVLTQEFLQRPRTERPAHNPVVAGLTARNLAYLIYTSGSTGLPKGVAIEHANTANLLYWGLQNFSKEELTNTLFATSINFDLAVYELFLPLAAGSTLTLVRNALALTTRTEPVTLVNTVPSAIKALLDAGAVPATTRLVNLAGEPLKQEIVERLLAETATENVANLYGPSETTTYSTWVRMPREHGFARHIGRPIANTQVYILDVHRQPVPIGVTGEIYIGGDGVARGYLNRPELTAERFLNNPFAAGRMYKTGDLGRWLPDGNIEYLGRNDFQVKIRGFRIELGEIEARLATCTGVREAVVIARDERLVAYVVGDAATSQLRESLLSQLPEYMVPSAFVQLEAMPLTSNGKLDRKALPAPDATTFTTRAYEPPQGEIEETLAAIWQELLRVDRVGRHDNFFDLGGHSLLAVQLISRIQSSLNVQITLRDIFASPSLQALAAATRDARTTTFGRIEIADRNQPLPLSLAQQRLWFLDQFDKAASAAYHMPASLRLLGKLDVAALQATLDRLVARHENLRTTFVAIGGVPYQQIGSADCGFALRHEDLRGLAVEERELLIAELTAAEACAAFDLSSGPLIRGQLLTIADEEHVLLITIHHIISDGWSLNVLLGEVAALYAAYSRGEGDPLPPLDVQYADYAVWQRNLLQGEELTRQFEFWKQQLSGAPELLELPLDRPRPAMQSYAGDSVPLTLSRELTTALRALSRQHGVTLFMTLLSAWGVLLSRLSGQSDVVIGAPVANRDRREVENLIGFFVNTLALRLHLDGDIAGLLQQVKETTLAALAHQELPFEQIVDALQVTRSLSHSPLFQSMLAFNNTPEGDGERSLPDLKLAPGKQTLTTSHYELSLSLNDSGETLSGMLVYASDLFDRNTIERWAGYFVQLLEAMVADSSAAVADLPLMSENERHQLLVDFNDTAAAYPKDTLIHQLFERQVAAQPDAIAVIFEDQQLTYAELNARANRLAHELIALGVRPDDRVAISVERSPEMIAGLLGILKAGGAYLPLDPSYPAERLQYLMQDGAPKVVLTQEFLQRPRTEQPAHDPVVAGLSARNLAYVIYTSGSTGLPKGVAIEHANTANLLHWGLQNFSNDALANTLFATSINFDLAVYELFLPLAAGSTLTLVHNALALTTRTEPVTLVNTVPSAIKALLDAGAVPTTARAVNLAGEPLKQEIVERLFAETATESVANLYGPSETTTYSTWVRMSREDGFTRHIGRPIANTQVYILDVHCQPVPIGVTGEIYIGGDGVARGYLNRPELTAERFLNNPFADGRMYKTADLGRWLPDGNIEYLGRNDFQVKIRGFRIELGEIEARLAQCAGVREAVVIAREERLVAYVVADEPLQASQLREALQSQLPEYMIPSAFVQLDAMPLTSNGKLDRKALPEPGAIMLAAHEYEPPQGEVEETLAALWRELLQVPRVGRHDNFFDLGGHSLLVVQFIHRLHSETPYRIEVRDLFQHRSLAALAAHITPLPPTNIESGEDVMEILG